MKNDLMKLANKYENKLGLTQVKTAETRLPKSLRKLAQAEQDFQKKLAKVKGLN